MSVAALSLSTAVLILIASAAMSYGLLLLLRPLLLRYALALPNARSSHKIPTPQGAGIGVIAATVAISALAALALDGIANGTLWIVLTATIGIAIVGAVDDIRPVPVLPRLLLQAAAVAAILIAIPADARVVPMLPFWPERLLLGLGAVWFVNLTNFMDGIDWITAAETVPVTAFIALFGVFGATSPTEAVVALALCGAMIGFAPLNRPVAKMFLGDVGSLAIGLLMAWMLVELAGRGHLAAAILLPLYYLADATLTLLRRLSRGETIWIAHRTHFYQRATQNGFSVMETVTRIFAVNVVLGLLALATMIWAGLDAQIVALACGVALVTWLLFIFNRGRASAS
ncbi:MraY family glycosyltransferase [Undibacter mobilis]|uniref:Glycosyl transferase n=1 Tax=Undibacter mobilis TaxID=2292256 RepID=A0A371BC29_9BRAD|nr:glycosyltransferase family 4 protein [Undibacter mobilis]RDV05110.1 glycosyl transferase [Undibacter mobilis]